MINDKHYTSENFKQYKQLLTEMELAENKGISIAACLEDTFVWLALCLFLKEQHISVMPLHPSTPLETAKQLAANAGCQLLFYKDLKTPISIEAPAAINEPQTGGLIQMSSGTTGEPKVIKRDWQAIDREIESYIATFDKANNMVPVVACPVTHSYGLICGVLVALARGQVPVIVTNINPRFLIKVLQGHEKPLLYSSPTMLQSLIRLWPKDAAPIYAVMTSGTMMANTTFEALSQDITHLFQQYGCSEAGCISINQNMTEIQDMGTPLPHIQLSCTGDKQNPGEIVIRLPQQENKLIHTQDLGYLKQNAQGEQRLYFVARQDDTIIMAGLNVYPQQVEDIILTHPAVEDALIFKVEDPYAGQAVALYYVSETLSANDLRQWCSQHLARYQIPQKLIAVNHIERMANGKVNRKKVAAQFLQKTASSHQERTHDNTKVPTSLA